MRSIISFQGLLLITLLVISGCDEPLQDTRIQDVGGVAWLPGGDRMLVFVEQQDYVQNTSWFEYKLKEASREGKIGRTIAPEISYAVVSPDIYISTDGQFAVTQLGNDLFRIRLSDGSKTLLASKLNLFVVSPDLKYALVTHAGLDQPIKTMSLLDISANAHVVKEFQLDSLIIHRGLWLKDNRFALTFKDSTGLPYVALYDTTGTQSSVFRNAELPYQSSDYDPVDDLLYVRTLQDEIHRISVSTGQRITLLEQANNLDVEGDLMAYIREESGKRTLYLRDLRSGVESKVADNPLRFAYLSPDRQRLAYLKEVRFMFDELVTVPVTRP